MREPQWWLHTIHDEASVVAPLCGCINDENANDAGCRATPAYRGQVTQPRGTFDVFACTEHVPALRQRSDLVRIASWTPPAQDPT